MGNLKVLLLGILQEVWCTMHSVVVKCSKAAGPRSIAD